MRGKGDSEKYYRGSPIDSNAAEEAEEVWGGIDILLTLKDKSDVQKATISVWRHGSTRTSINKVDLLQIGF